MKKWNLIIDIAKCHDCNNCFLACKDEFCENDHAHYAAAQPRHGHRWMNILRKERGQYPKVDVAYLPSPCMHCDEPACMAVAKDGAVYKRDDGIVILDPVKAGNRKDLLEACPYNAIWWNEEKQLPQKCNLCAHLLDTGWKEPRCVQSCPTGAMRIELLEDEEMQKKVDDEQLEAYQPSCKTRPRVHYRNLYRYTQCFIAGNAALEDVDECAEGAGIRLFKNDQELITECKTNNYGDFKFDNLPPKSGSYRLELEYPGYEMQIVHLNLVDSVTLKTVFFRK